MFKKILLVSLATAAVSVSSAFAAGTATLNVQAAVVGNCKFNTASATMNFGSLDPANSTDASGAASLQFWCTKSAAYTITDDGGANKSGTQRRMKDAGTNFINYSIGAYTASGTGNGKGSPITLNLTGSVLNADYVNATAGAYTDVVTFTINP
jgi:spore coat protein U-like protein